MGLDDEFDDWANLQMPFDGEPMSWDALDLDDDGFDDDTNLD